MRDMFKTASTVAMAALMMGGCASTAKGLSNSRMKTLAADEPLTQDVPDGTVLAVVRYPAFVEDDAREAYYDAFTRATLEGPYRAKADVDADATAIADGVIVKSNYFALSLFKELAAELPTHSVLLSPHAIKLDEDGTSLTSEPMTQAESLPNAVRVDFAAYSYPDVNKMMGGLPLTFGDLLTPMITVRTDPRASAATQGLLMSSRPLLSQAAGNSAEARRETLANLQAGRLDTAVPELDFVSHLDRDATQSVAAVGLVPGAAENAVSVYPVEKVKLDGLAINTLAEETEGIIDPMETAFSEGFANQIVAIINDLDLDKAAMLRRADAIAQFDDNLAALSVLGSAEPDYLGRMRYAERLLEAQRKYLSVQSLRLFDGVHNGEMGAQVRDMLRAEYDILQRRRKLARQQNIATAVAVAATVATVAGTGSSNPGERVTRADRFLNRALFQSAILATSRAMGINKQSKGVMENYLASIVPALEGQTSVQVDLIDSNETITAIRFEDLQAKLQTLYADNQRALGTVATRCGYEHDTGVREGTWMGVCENGVANGAGIGVLVREDGSGVEYYGQAVNGRPEGVGYLIIHEASGESHSLEGTFRGGVAEGPMTVARGGAATQARQYSAGRDVGSAQGRPASPFQAGDLAPMPAGMAG